MSYLGEKPAQTLAAPTSQFFNGDGSTVAFTLNRAVNVAEDLDVFVNNVRQEPGVGKSYTATGTTLTFDAAPSSGTANVYVVYRGLAEVTTRLEHDANAALAATTGTFSGAVSAASATVTGDLTVDTNTLYVDSTNNRVGVGTSSASELLHVKNASGDAAVRIDGNTRSFKIEQNNYGLRFVDIDAGSAERLRIIAGGGITFNGDTAAANALDDYEEGTWTASYGSSGSNTGNYRKIGGLVYAQVTLNNTSQTFQVVTGLPYTPSQNNIAGKVGRIIGFSGWDRSNLGCEVNTTSGGQFQMINAGGGAATITAGTGTVRLDLAIVYPTA